MIVFGDEFSTGGYAPIFVTDWLDDSVQKGLLIDDGYQISLTE